MKIFNRDLYQLKGQGGVYPIKAAISILLLCQFALSEAQQLSDTVLIDEVVISAGRIKVARASAPLSVTTITSDFISGQEETNILPIVAKKTPGLFVSETGVAGYVLGNNTSGQLTIRGVGGSPNSRVMMMVDGQPQFMGIFGHPLPNFHMTSNVDRVEVIRGPASLIYGSNAMGGVINVITKMNEEEGLSGNAYLTYGAYNTFKYGVAAGYKKNKISAGIRFNQVKTDGHRDSSEFSNTNVHAFVGYEMNDHWSMKAGFTIADYSFMDPGAEFLPNTISFKGEIQRNLISVSLTNNYEKTSGGLFFFHNSGVHDFSDGWYSRDNNAGINLFQTLKPWEGATITAGIDFKRYGADGSFSNIVPPTFQLVNYNDTSLSMEESAAYLVAGQSFGKIAEVTVGGRYEWHSNYEAELIPQIGIVIRPYDGGVIKGLISKGFRNPTLMELYLFPPANPDLRPEKLMNYEASFSHRLSDKTIVSGTVYLMNGSNLIITAQNPSPPPPVRRYNGGTMRNWGIEVESAYYPSRDLRLDLSYSYLVTDKPVLFAPEHQLFLGGNYKFGVFSFSLNLNPIIGLQTSNDEDIPVAERSESYVLLDSKITYYHNDIVNLFVAGKNLLNQEYQTVYGYPMPKIYFMAGVSVGFK